LRLHLCSHNKGNLERCAEKKHRDDKRTEPHAQAGKAVMNKGPRSDLLEDLELLRSNAVAAGILALAYFRQPLKTWSKDNASPVTEADILVDQFLKSSLTGARPDYGWLSEESIDDPARLDKRRVFVVDPIDGTRAFIRGEDCWTVSLAVVEDGIAVAGVVYAPARDEMFDAVLDGGACFNGHPLMRPVPVGDLTVIPAPGAIHRELEAAGIEYEHGPALPSLAYRLVQVATGRFAAVAGRRGAHDWDIAGAAIILSECGVAFDDVCAGTIRLNRSDTRHAALAAIADRTLKTPLHDALRHVYGCPSVEADAELPQRQGL
jgi:myo-inositol-1(or 4)-monophosphatase